MTEDERSELVELVGPGKPSARRVKRENIPLLKPWQKRMWCIRSGSCHARHRAASEATRNEAEATIEWLFDVDRARKKLPRAYTDLNRSELL